MTTIPITGLDLRNAGIAATLAADTAPHRDAAPFIRQAVEDLASTHREFTAEDVRARIAGNEHVAQEIADRPNLLPAVFSGAANAGLIRAVGYTRATRRSRHASVMRVWQGVAA